MSDALADPPEMLPRGLSRDKYESYFRSMFGFRTGEVAVSRTDVMGEPVVIPDWLVRKVLRSGLERGAYLPVLPRVLSGAQEVWLVPYRVGDRIRLRKHLLYGSREGRGATGAIVVAELDGCVWRGISMSPLDGRTIEQKRRGVLVWRRV